MLSLKVFANTKPNNNNGRRKAVDKRRAQVKDITKQLRKISEEERERVKDLWKMHRNFFVDDETMDVVVMPESSINDFFDQ